MEGALAAVPAQQPCPLVRVGQTDKLACGMRTGQDDVLLAAWSCPVGVAGEPGPAHVLPRPALVFHCQGGGAAAGQQGEGGGRGGAGQTWQRAARAAPVQ